MPGCTRKIMLRGPCRTRAAQAYLGTRSPWKTWGNAASRESSDEFCHVARRSSKAMVHFVAPRKAGCAEEKECQSFSPLKIQAGSPTNTGGARNCRCCATNRPSREACCCAAVQFLRIREPTGAHCQSAPFAQLLLSQRVAPQRVRSKLPSLPFWCLLRTRSPTRSSLWLGMIGGYRSQCEEANPMLPVIRRPFIRTGVVEQL